MPCRYWNCFSKPADRSFCLKLIAMRERFERFWAKMNEMPGPVWVLGAWAVMRFVKWAVFVMPVWIPNGSESDAATVCTKIGSLAAMLAGQLFPLAALWALVSRRSYTVSLTRLYIGMKGLSEGIGLITTVVHSLDSSFSWTGIAWTDRGLDYGAGLVMCVAMLLWLDRSRDVARLFPVQERRRVPGSWALGLVAFVAITLGGM